MKKKCQLVMLATEKSKICLKGDYLFYDHQSDIVLIKTSLYKPQHLYVISDDEIKVGDWFYADEFAKPEQAKYFEGNLVNGFIKSACKKIIATNDESLGLPRPSNEFIKAYVNAYNKGKQITDIMVEYGDAQMEDFESDNYPRYETILKIAPDNTISIFPVEEEKTYTRDEVIELLRQYNAEIMFKFKIAHGPYMFKQWTEKHL